MDTGGKWARGRGWEPLARQPVDENSRGLPLEVIRQQGPAAGFPCNKIRKGEIIPSCKRRLVSISAVNFWESDFLSPSASPLSRAYCSEFKTRWPSF